MVLRVFLWHCEAPLWCTTKRYTVWQIVTSYPRLNLRNRSSFYLDLKVHHQIRNQFSSAWMEEINLMEKIACGSLINTSVVINIWFVIKADNLTGLTERSLYFAFSLVLLGESYLLIQIMTHFISHVLMQCISSNSIKTLWLYKQTYRVLCVWCPTKALMYHSWKGNRWDSYWMPLGCSDRSALSTFFLLKTK